MPSPDTPSRLPLGSGTAVFSECGSYRYLLTRNFDTGRGSCLFVMLNPSTADAGTNDPTIRRCANFAKSWGYAELRIVNLFALRSADPRNLEIVEDPIGAENDRVLREELQASGSAIAAWGNMGAIRRRSSAVRKMMSDLKVSGMCLAHNVGGEPVHPLYVATATRPRSLR